MNPVKYNKSIKIFVMCYKG